MSFDRWWPAPIIVSVAALSFAIGERTEYDTMTVRQVVARETKGGNCGLWNSDSNCVNPSAIVCGPPRCSDTQVGKTTFETNIPAIDGREKCDVNIGKCYVSFHHGPWREMLLRDVGVYGTPAPAQTPGSLGLVRSQDICWVQRHPDGAIAFSAGACDKAVVKAMLESLPRPTEEPER